MNILTMLAASALLFVAGVVGSYSGGRVAEPERATSYAVTAVQPTARLDAPGRDEVEAAMPVVAATGSAPLVRDLSPTDRVRVLTIAQWRAIRDSGGPPVTVAMHATCESGWDEKAVGKANEAGVMQLHPVHEPWLRSIGYTWGQMFEMGPNLRAAVLLAERDGWGIWTTAGGCREWTR
jgi:hypothetical protein